MKRFNLFKETVEEEKKYTTKINAPVYLPTGPTPHILELFDDSKALRLIKGINESNLPQEQKDFLILAAYRHVVFNYEKVAEYYAGATKEVQELMELSALVIIDFEKAVEHGYIKLSDEIKEQFLEEYEK